MMQLKIILCDPCNHDKQLPLIFDLWENSLVDRWSKCLVKASHSYPIDDTQRFYGLNSVEQEIHRAIAEINRCVDTINADIPIIDRRISDINDTDTLNYLHHIFEIYHGMLDRQDNEDWRRLGTATRQALADLNIAVHRVENVIYGNKPRFTVTYFGLPKSQFLQDDDYRWSTNNYTFGGLYLNYVEIGKTLADLERDNDQHIHAEAFQPWQRFSADFVVRLYDSDVMESRQQQHRCRDFFLSRAEFFSQLGYHIYNRKLAPGSPSLGQLIYTDKQQMLSDIAQHQQIKSVELA
jgi:hypothetical protein